MTLTDAQHIIEALARGIDPETGEVPPGQNALSSSPQVVRALFLAADALRKTIQAPTGAPKAVPASSTDASAAISTRPAMAGKPWTAEEDEQLLKAFDAGASVKDLTLAHGRSRGGISSRLMRFGKIQEKALRWAVPAAAGSVPSAQD